MYVSYLDSIINNIPSFYIDSNSSLVSDNARHMRTVTLTFKSFSQSVISFVGLPSGPGWVGLRGVNPIQTG